MPLEIHCPPALGMKTSTDVLLILFIFCCSKFPVGIIPAGLYLKPNVDLDTYVLFDILPL